MRNYEEYGFVPGTTSVYIAPLASSGCSVLMFGNIIKPFYMRSIWQRQLMAHEIDLYLAAKGANNYLDNLD